MGWVTENQHDVFLSYAHENNQPAFPGELGWVDQFRIDLEGALRSLIGRPEGLSLWMDPRLRGNDDFGVALDDAVTSAQLFACVSSPSYANSPWCGRECADFHRAHGNVGPKRGSWPIFRIEHTPLPPEQKLPFEDLRLRGYKFYATDPLDRERFEPYRRTDSRDRDQRYWNGLRDVAQDMTRVLKLLKSGAPPPPPARRVRLGASPGLAEERDALRAWLASLDVMAVEAAPGALDPALDQAEMSVLLLSGEADPWARTQVERSAGRPLFIWVKGTVSADLLPLLEPTSNAPVVLVGACLDALQERVRLALFPEPLPVAVPAPRPTATGPPVYIACDAGDLDYAGEMGRYLFTRGLGVIVSLPKEDLRQYKSLLNACSALLILYGGTTPDWVRDRALAAVGAASRRKKNPIRAMSIYDLPPPVKDELNLWLPGVPVRNCRSGFQSAKLEEFIRSLGATP